jgi:hypothetical protein
MIRSCPASVSKPGPNEGAFPNQVAKDDVEMGLTNGHAENDKYNHPHQELNHYELAKHLINYQALDVGKKCKLRPYT